MIMEVLQQEMQVSALTLTPLPVAKVHQAPNHMDPVKVSVRVSGVGDCTWLLPEVNPPCRILEEWNDSVLQLLVF